MKKKNPQVADAVGSPDMPEAADAQGAPEKPVRRSQEARSRDARARLLAATIDVLMRRGYNGFSTKEVAKCAGLSNGAIMHHYPTKAELVVAATESVYEEALKRGHQSASSPEAMQNPIEAFIADCLSVYFDWPFLAALEIIVVARTDDALMARILPVMENYRRQDNTVWLEVFRKAGLAAADARIVLNLTLNMTRGMAVNRMWQKDEKHYRAYIKAWIGIISVQFPLQKSAVASAVKSRK